MFLRQVDELEVDRERARDAHGSMRVHRFHELQDIVPAFVRRLAPVGDRGAAEPLDVGEELGAFRLLDHTPEERAECLTSRRSGAGTSSSEGIAPQTPPQPRPGASTPFGSNAALSRR